MKQSQFTKDGFGVLPFATKQQFYEWMLKNHQDAPGLWLRLYKKNSSKASINWEQAVEVLLCFGWIDSVVNKYDDISFIQRVTPRRKRSVWSKKNCATVERLIKEKLMHPSGLAQVEAAQADGRWEAAYDSPKDMKVPDDFIKLLADYPKAEAFFKTLNKTNTFAIAFRLNTAKKPETRERRIQSILAMLSEGKKLY